MCGGHWTVYGNSLFPSVYLGTWDWIQVIRLSACHRTWWSVSLVPELSFLSSIKLCLWQSLGIKTGMNVNLCHSGKFPKKAHKFISNLGSLYLCTVCLLFKPAPTLLFLEYLTVFFLSLSHTHQHTYLQHPTPTPVATGSFFPPQFFPCCFL